MNENNFRQLLDNYVTGQISGSDQEKFFNLLEDEEYLHQLERILKEEWEESTYESQENIQLRNLIEQRLLNKIKSENGRVLQLSSRRGTFWLKVSGAAAVVLILMISAIFFLGKNNHEIAGTPIKTPVINDILPGGNKAILTLGDGRNIVLDTASNGALTVQGGINVIKIGAQLSYNDGSKSTQVVYNTITTPRGGQYQLELPDGSKVWLNAASSLKFPTAFVGNERAVELTGEGYFEVIHDPDKPFHVKVNDLDVRVLGTHFNINSYADEPEVKTTLLEGRVMVRNSSSLVYLNPGQQAKTSTSGSRTHVDNDVDVDEVMAWKNGYFSFNNADIKTVMRQLSRWYNIDVVYEGNNDETFSGKIDRKLSLRDLLDGLGQTKVHYRIESEGKLVILP